MEIRPYIGNFGNKSFTYDGKINIHFQCLTPTKNIVFHSTDLNIQIEELVYNQTEFKEIYKIDEKLGFDIEREFVIAKLNRNCVSGQNFILKLNYSGKFSTQLFGLYLSTYTDKNNVSKL